jgi:hypothetical protein
MSAIGPILFYEVETPCAAVRFLNYGLALGDRNFHARDP